MNKVDDVPETESPLAKTDPHALRVGVVGLGTIGSGVVESLDRSGVESTGFDIDPRKVESLPCAPAGSAAQLAAVCDLVLVSVVNADQAKEALFGVDGVTAGARPNLIVGLISTVSVEALMEMATTAAAAGIRLLDTPVTAGQHAATNGLIVMVGGDRATADEAMSTLHAFAKAAIYCGPLGAGMAAKLVRQIVVFGSWKVMYDAARFARAVGVEYERVKAITQEADANGETVLGLMGLRGNSLAELPEAKQQELRRYYDLMVKDIHAAQELGRSHDFQLPLLEELLTDPGPEMYGLPKRS